MENGIILLDKEKGLTSRQVDNALEKRLGTRKVGHLGTLDPFATGLLLIGVNKGTKFLPYLDDSKKSYIASLVLGKRTASGDEENPILETRPVPPLSDASLSAALSSFLGKSSQIPPMTSAIKVDGVPLYKKAHQGESVEREARAIEIFSINLASYKENTLVFTCTVSRGTYIRVLGEDIAAKLGTIGYLTSLRRLSIGCFMVSDAKKIGELNEKDILDPTLFITTMKHVEIDDDWLGKVKNGQPLFLKEDYGEKVLLVLHEEALAVYARLNGNYYVSERGLF